MSKQRTSNYYKELPEGYKEVYCINAKKTSVGVIMNVIAFAVALALIVGICFAKFELPLNIEFGLETALSLFALCVTLIAYMVVHELTHGLFYKILTRQKLRFGLTLSVAYCGLKEGYVNKKTCLLAVLAPLVIHSIWMILLIIFLPANIWALMIIILFGLHFGGCIGDMWVAFMLIFRFNSTVLTCDDGPCQRFYEYRPEEVVQPETQTVGE
ncbi:MAG: DUF3267 domain-containing protein [Candidatus Coproplasma sp.]